MEMSKQTRNSGKRTDLDYSNGFNIDNAYSDSIPNATYHDFAATGRPCTRIRLSGYVALGYDNPGFARPVLEPSTQMLRMHTTRRVSDSSDSRSIELPEWRKTHRCRVIAGIVFLVLVIAAVIAVAVHFSDLSSEDEKLTSEDASQQDPDFEGQIRVTSFDYSSDLSDPNSAQYKDTKSQMENYIDSAFKNSDIWAVYNYSQVTGFSNGSVLVNFLLYMIVDVEVTPSNQTPEPHQTDVPLMTNDLISLLKLVKSNRTIVMSAFLQGIQFMESVIGITITVDKTQIVITISSTSALTTTAASISTSTASTPPSPSANASLETTSMSAMTTRTTQLTSWKTTATSSLQTNITQTPTTTKQSNSTTQTNTSLSTISSTKSLPTISKAPEAATSPTNVTKFQRSTSQTLTPTSPLTFHPTTSSATNTSTFLPYASPETNKTTPFSPTTAGGGSSTAIGMEGNDDCPDWLQVEELTSTLCVQSLALLKTATAAEEACDHYANTVKCVVFTLRLRYQSCSADHLFRVVQSNYTFTSHANDIPLPSVCSATSLRFSVDLDTTPWCQIPDVYVYILRYVPVTDFSLWPQSTTKSPILDDYVQPNPCTHSLQIAAHVTSVLQSLGLWCDFQNMTSFLSRQNFSTIPELELAVDRCRDYSEKLEKSEDQCLNLTNVEQQECLIHFAPFFSPPDISDTEACRSVNDTVTCMTAGNDCSERDSWQSVTNYLSLLYTYHQLGNVTLTEGTNFPNIYQALTCASRAANLGTCPDWPEVTEVTSMHCNNSLTALSLANTTEEACSHYANTIKCAVYILHSRHRNCSVDTLLQQWQNIHTYTFFSNHTGQIHLPSTCSAASVQFSVDVNKTPLCQIPDVLLYIVLYMPLPLNASPPSIPANPCMIVLRQAAHVTSVLQSLGLACNFQDVTISLTHQNFATIPEFDQAVATCRVYTEYVQSEDQCFNLTSDSQQECLVHFTPFFNPLDISDIQACRAANDTVVCLADASGCNERDIWQSVANYLSLLFTYNHLGNVTLVPDVNFRNILKALICGSAAGGEENCPGWTDITEVVSMHCNSSLMALWSANTTLDACFHYSHTIKCAVYTMLTQNRKCSLEDLFQMSQNNQTFFTNQAGIINLASVCPEASIQFSVDVNNTALCQVPDALMYIAYYLPVDSYDNQEGADTSGSTMSPQTMSTSLQLGSYSANPCTTALRESARVISALQSLGLTCDFQSVTDILFEQVFPIIPGINKEVDRCRVYSDKLERGQEECFNLSNQSPQQQCIVHMTSFFSPADITASEACCSTNATVACLVTNGHCSETESWLSVTNFLSFMLTYHDLGNVTVASGSNFRNMYKAFIC